MVKIKKHINLKNELLTINKWSRVDDPNFTSKEYIAIPINDNNIKEKFGIKKEIDELILEFVIGKNFISYSPTNSSLYDLSEESLFELAENFHVMDFHETKNFKVSSDCIYICKFFASENIRFIPLDNKILIETNETIEFILDDVKYFSKPIKK